MEPPRPESERRRLRFRDGLRLIAGIVVASLAAGPVFLLLPMVAAALAGVDLGADDGFPMGGGSLWLLPVLAVREMFLPALIATTLGAVSLTVAGAMVPEARTYKVWIVAGAIEALLVCLLFPALLQAREMILAMVLAGTVCAAICRAFTRWPEETGDAQA
jgi:hypothetical protein